MEELNKDEINAYTLNCGSSKLQYVIECFWVSPFLTEME